MMRWITSSSIRCSTSDLEHKFVRKYEVTDASVHDSQVIDDVLEKSITNKDVYADSAYKSEAISERLEDQGYRDRIHRKAVRGRPLSDRDKAANKNKRKCAPASSTSSAGNEP